LPAMGFMCDVPIKGEIVVNAIILIHNQFSNYYSVLFVYGDEAISSLGIEQDLSKL